MIKKLGYLFILIGFAATANSQTIAKWKIEDVVKSYSANNDTVYIVNFWATFCKPCIEEIPDFIRIVEKYKSQKVKLLLVSLDLSTYVATKLPAFIKKNNYNTNHVWLNETNADHFCPMIDEKWSGAIPSTIIVNNKTGYRKFVEDQMSAEEFEASLNEAIGGTAMMKFDAPMNDAEIIEKSGVEVDEYTAKLIAFKSADSSVFAVMDGKVKNIVRIENFKVVIVEAGNIFYSYSNLGSTQLHTGDLVKRNQVIGFATVALNGDLPMLDFYLSNAEKSIQLTKANFTARKDKGLKDYFIDRLDEPQ